MIPEFGKHATLIWICYGVSLTVLGALILHILRLRKAAEK